MNSPPTAAATTNAPAVTHGSLDRRSLQRPRPQTASRIGGRHHAQEVRLEVLPFDDQAHGWAPCGHQQVATSSGAFTARSSHNRRRRRPLSTVNPAAVSARDAAASSRVADLQPTADTTVEVDRRGTPAPAGRRG